MQQLIQILQIILDSLLGFFEALRNNTIYQIVTAVWLLIGGTWEKRRDKLKDDIGTLLTHPLYYDPKTYSATPGKQPVLYPFNIFQEIRIGFNSFASQLRKISAPAWKQSQAIFLSPDKIALGLVLLGFFYADLIVGYAIAYESDLIPTIPTFFQPYSIAVAFATIGSALAAGLVIAEALRADSQILQNKAVKRWLLFFSAILFLLSILTSVGISMEFIISKSNLNQTIIEYITLASSFSLQVLTRVNSLLATLLLPFVGALSGLTIVFSFLLEILAVIVDTIGTILIVIIDLIIRIVVVLLALLVFLVFAPPERLLELIFNRKKSNT